MTAEQEPLVLSLGLVQLSVVCCWQSPVSGLAGASMLLHMQVATVTHFEIRPFQRAGTDANVANFETCCCVPISCSQTGAAVLFSSRTGNGGLRKCNMCKRQYSVLLYVCKMLLQIRVSAHPTIVNNTKKLALANNCVPAVSCAA